MSQPDGPLDLGESAGPFSCSYLHDRAGRVGETSCRYGAAMLGTCTCAVAHTKYRCTSCILPLLLAHPAAHPPARSVALQHCGQGAYST